MRPGAARYCAAALLIAAAVNPTGAIQYPSPPQAPTVAEPQAESPATPTRNKKNAAPPKAVPLVNLRLRIHLGDKSVLLAEAALPTSYSFTHKKGQIQYNQTVRAKDIRELVIENYRARKIAGNKDGEVFEFEPAQVRIELKDGQSFRLDYLFKELRKIRAKNEDGSFSVFAFFADTYKGKAGWQERSGDPSTSSGTGFFYSKRAHPAAYTKLDYFEPVDKAGNPLDSARDRSETQEKETGSASP